MAIDKLAAERAVSDFLRALGVSDVSRVDLTDTPRRVVEAYAEDLLVGYATDMDQLLEHGSEPCARQDLGVVVVRGIDVTTLCPHHLMPSTGEATVAYLPGKRILGLGTIAHVVDAFARRLSLQETISEQVVETLIRHGARGAHCKIELTHSCLSARGARQSRARVVTLATRGELATPEGQSQLHLALSDEARG